MELARFCQAARQNGPQRLPKNQREVGMTRTDTVAPSGPRKASAASLSSGSSRAWRMVSVVPIALLLAAVLFSPATALAAENTSGYSQTVPAPKTTPSTTPTSTTPSPSTGTSPSKEEKSSTEKTTPSKETSPTSSETPTSTSSSSKSGSLPFTGFDLRWALGAGLLLTAGGFSLLMVERRRRRAGR
jgi:uncharacterized surface anchored protein